MKKITRFIVISIVVTIVFLAGSIRPADLAIAAEKFYTVEVCLTTTSQEVAIDGMQIIINLDNSVALVTTSGQDGCGKQWIEPSVLIKSIELVDQNVEILSVSTNGAGQLPDSDAANGYRKVWVQVGLKTRTIQRPVSVPTPIPDPVPPMAEQPSYEVSVDYMPVCYANASPARGTAPLNVMLTGAGSYDPDGNGIISWNWTFGNGKSTNETVDVTFANAGKYTINLTVMDGEGNMTSCDVSVIVDSAEDELIPKQHVVVDQPDQAIGSSPKAFLWVDLLLAFLFGLLLMAFVFSQYRERQQAIEAALAKENKHLTDKLHDAETDAAWRAGQYFAVMQELEYRRKADQLPDQGNSSLAEDLILLWLMSQLLNDIPDHFWEEV